MSKTTKELLQDFHRQLVAVGKYNVIDSSQFKTELADLFNEKFLLDPLFEFSKPKLDENEQEKINKIYEVALMDGDISNAKIALNFGAEPLYREGLGLSPLENAVYKGDTELLKFLVALGWNVNLGSFNMGLSPLYIASKNADLATVRVLMEELGAYMDQIPVVNSNPYASNCGRYLPILGAITGSISCGSIVPSQEVLHYYISKGVDHQHLGANEKAIIEKAKVKFPASQAAAEAVEEVVDNALLEVPISAGRLKLSEEQKIELDEYATKCLLDGDVELFKIAIEGGANIGYAVGQERSLPFIQALYQEGFNLFTNLGYGDAETKVNLIEIVAQFKTSVSERHVGVTEEKAGTSEESSAAAAGGHDDTEIAGGSAPEPESDF